MLIIIMHDKIDYLNALDILARKEGINNAGIIQKQDLGFELRGQQVDFILQRGCILPHFDKAFVAVVNPVESKRLLNLVQYSNDLAVRSLNAEGFICTVPFDKIKNLVFDSSLLHHARPENGIWRIFRPRRIQLELSAGSPQEAISLTASPLKEADEINDFPKFLHDVMAREEISSTAIGNGIAIPHARSNAVKKLVISVGRFDKGINFGAVDSMPVKLLFLIGSPCVKGPMLNEYLTTLAELSRHLNDEDFCRTLLNVSMPNEFINTVLHSEQELPAKLT